MSRFRLLHLTLAVALLALLLWKADIGDVGDVLNDADLAPVLAVIALDAPALFLLFVRARFVLTALDHDVPAKVLLPVSVLGNVAGSLTPASAGELLRAGVLHTHAEVTPEDALALVVYERGMSVYILGLGTGMVAAMLALAAVPAAAVAIAVVALLLAPLVLARSLPVPTLARRTARGGIPGLVDRLQRSVGQLRALFADASLLLRWSAVTAVIFAINAAQLLLLTRSVSGGVSMPEAWVAFGTSQLAGIASLLPLGLGAADGSLAAVLREMDLSLHESTGVAVLVRLATTLPLGIAAVASYIYLVAQTPARAPAPEVASSPVEAVVKRHD